MESNEYDSEIWKRHNEGFSVSWYETVLAKMESEFDIVVAENEKLKRQVEAIKQAAVEETNLDIDDQYACICAICKDRGRVHSKRCEACWGNFQNWQPPEVGE